jgi:hypothetical protein
MQRIKTLLIMQILIDNSIGDVGNTLLIGKKIKVVTNKMNGYERGEHKLHVKFRPQKANVNDDERLIQDADLSIILLHEFSHTYHSMLGMPGEGGKGSWDQCKSLFYESYLRDKALRERLVPLLNKEVFSDTLNALKDSETAHGALLFPWHEVEGLEYYAFYQFLEANEFFGNELLKFPKNDRGEVVGEEKARALLILKTCELMEEWWKAEEMLTIAGFVPLYFGEGSEYVLLDRQNEDVQMIKDGYKWIRQTHLAFKKIHDGLDMETTMEAMLASTRNHGLFLYGDQEGMAPTSQSVYEVAGASLEVGEPISVEEMSEAIMGAVLPGQIAEMPTGDELRYNGCYPRVIRESDREYECIMSMLGYAVREGIKISDEAMKFCAATGTLRTDILDCYMKDKDETTREAKLLELLEYLVEASEEGSRAQATKEILAYVRDKAIKIFELDRFIDRTNQIVEAINPKNIESIAELLKYACENGVTPRVDDFQTIFEKIYAAYGSREECIDALLRYAESAGIVLDNARGLLEEPPLGSTLVSRNFKPLYEYAVRKGVARELGEYLTLYKDEALHFDKLADCILELDRARGTTIDVRPYLKNDQNMDVFLKYLDKGLAEEALKPLMEQRLRVEKKFGEAELKYCLDNNLDIVSKDLVVQSLTEHVASDSGSNDTNLFGYINKFRIKIPGFEGLLAQAIKNEKISAVHGFCEYARSGQIAQDLTEQIIDKIKNRWASNWSFRWRELFLSFEGDGLTVDLERCRAAAIEVDNGSALLGILECKKKDEQVEASDYMPGLIGGGKYDCIMKLFHEAEKEGYDFTQETIESCMERALQEEKYHDLVDSLFDYVYREDWRIRGELVVGYHTYLERERGHDKYRIEECEKYAASKGIALSEAAGG